MRKATAFVIALVVAMGCGPDKPGPVSPVASTVPPPSLGPFTADGGAPSGVEGIMRSQNLAAQMNDVVSGRKVPHNFTGIERDPGLLLGSVYVLKAREGKTCASQSADDYEEDRLPDFRKSEADGCRIDPFPQQTEYSQIVSGKASGQLDLIVGSGKVDVDSDYELTVEDAATAAFASPRKCIDQQALLAQDLPDRTCRAYFIVDAVLTHVTWRAYRKADRSAQATYLALINVGGELMGSTSEMKMTPIISVDTVDPGTWKVARDGFLHVIKKAPEKAASKIALKQTVQKLDELTEAKQYATVVAASNKGADADLWKRWDKQLMWVPPGPDASVCAMKNGCLNAR